MVLIAKIVKQDITVREMDVMRVLCRAKEPLIASEILKRDDSLNLNTVQAVIRTLLEKQYIEVDSVVYSGTVLSRSYKPTDLFYDKMIMNFVQQAKEIKEYLSSAKLIKALCWAMGEEEIRKCFDAHLEENMQ